MISNAAKDGSFDGTHPPEIKASHVELAIHLRRPSCGVLCQQQQSGRHTSSEDDGDRQLDCCEYVGPSTITEGPKELGHSVLIQ